jgi:hypothetical protein
MTSQDRKARDWFNPLLPHRRGRAWAADAMAAIHYLRVKADVMCARERRKASACPAEAAWSVAEVEALGQGTPRC